MERVPKPDEVDPWSLIPGLALAFRREILNYELWKKSVNHKRPSERMAHDQWICFMGTSLGPMVHLEEKLVRYRQHGSNTFGVFLPQKKSALSRAMQYVTFALDSFRGTDANARAKRAFWYDIVYGTQQGTKRRIELLREMLTGVSNEYREQIERSLAYHEGLAVTLADRLPAYERATRTRRARALIAAVARGAYRGKNAGFKELLQDCFFGVWVSLPA